MINIYDLIEWCTTSSVLILAVLLIRLFTKKHLSPVLRYSLWLVVLVRLLIPFNPLDSIFSVMNVAEPVIDASSSLRSIIDIAYHSPHGFYYDSNNILNYQAYETSGRYLITAVWGFGMFVAADHIFCTNWSLWRKLKLSRQPLFDHTDPTRPRVYAMPGLVSPCLFGFRHPSIYLTPGAMADQETLQYATAHEQAHYRHGDHIWGLLRLLALILHWYNPLVWIACYLSKQDSEVAADDLSLLTLG